MGIHMIAPHLPLGKLIPAIFYPDPNPEVTSVDGSARRFQAGSDWADIHDGAGNLGQHIGTDRARLISWAAGDAWNELWRTIFLFDTSTIPLGATIVSAIVSLYIESRIKTFAWEGSLGIYASTPASNIAIVAADYQEIGIVELATPIGYNSIVAREYNDFQLNAAGLAAITKGGITKMGAREGDYDAPNIRPAGMGGGDWDVAIGCAETLPYPSQAPRLTVIYRI